MPTPVKALAVPVSFWRGLAGLVTILVVFEFVARAELLPSRWFPPVTVMFAALLELGPTGPYWRDIGLTLQGWAVGLGLTTLVAVPVGMLIGSFEVVHRACRLVIEFLRPVPSVALIPAAVLLFGVGMTMKVFLVAFAAFWPVLFQAIYGVRDVDPAAVDTAKVYGLGPTARFFRIVLPSTAPYLATGVRISSAIALILAVTAELVVGAEGLGRAIVVAQSGGAVPRMYALIVTAGTLGWLLNAAFQTVERRVLAWHPSQREVAA